MRYSKKEMKIRVDYNNMMAYAANTLWFWA